LMAKGVDNDCSLARTLSKSFPRGFCAGIVVVMLFDEADCVLEQ